MLALKKKRADEAKARAEEEAAEAAAGAVQTPGTAPSASNKVSLLGVGGRRRKESDKAGTNGGKRRSPGEIRIQKGEEFLCWLCWCVGAADRCSHG